MKADPSSLGDPSGERLRRRTRRLRIGAGVAIVVFVWLVMAGIEAWRLGSDALAGTRVAHTARQSVAGAQDVLEGRPDRALAEAQRYFADASERARSWVLAPLRVVPLAGRQLRAVEAVTAGAGTIADVGADGLADVRAVLEAPHRSGPERVALLRRLADVAEHARARLDQVDPGPGGALVPPVAGAREELVEELADLRAGLEDGRALASVLGDLLQGPGRYLVLGVNNAEMRAGAGMPSSLGELETANGHMRLDDMRPTAHVPVPDDAVPPSGDPAARWGWLGPDRGWRNLLVSPRFEVSASRAAQMWEAAGNRPVDGVVLLDPLALEAILDATGPVEVDGRVMSSGNVVDRLLVQQYLRVPDESPEQHRDELGVVAPAAISALDRGEWSTAQLADGLNGAVRGRHLMIWSRTPHQQDAWHATEVDGSLRPDSVMVSVLNRGGDKLDPYLRVQAQLELRPEDGHRSGVLQLTLRNDAPEGAPGLVLGPHPGIEGREGDYVGIVAVDLPEASTAGVIEPGPELAAAADGPTGVVATHVVVARGEERTVVVRFTLPAHQRSVRVEPSARAPSVAWRFRGATWVDVRARMVAW